MRQDFLSAIQNNRDWMKRFTRLEYFQAFKDYTTQFAPIYICEIKEAASNNTLQELVEEVLKELEGGWAKQRIWNRGTAKYNDKQMLISYLSPMLMGLEDAECQQFARLLQQTWAERWPKDAYQIATYKEIRKGFRNVILGLEFKDDLRELEEAQEEAEKNKK